MTRHARNCTAGAVYTYHERKKDTEQSGYGSKSMRLGKDSVKNFDCCSLTLQPCRNPVVTVDGHLYDKEAILENIIQQKKDIARKMKEYEKQQAKLDEEAGKSALEEKQATKRKFIEKESSIVSKPLNVFAKKAKISEEDHKGSSVSNMKEEKAKQLPSFWIPSLTPQAKASVIEKPNEKVHCPMSGKPLRLKDLIDVKFTPINDRDEKKALIVKDARYVCAVTNDVLSNSVPCVVLRTSGNVVTEECLEKIIKKDMIDPTCGKRLREKDIVRLQRGATGFAGVGVNLKSKQAGAAMMA